MTDKQEWLQCMKYVPGYEHDHASLSQMREYTHCVQVLHPVDPVWPAKAKLVLGVEMALLLGALVYVAYYVRRRKPR